MTDPISTPASPPAHGSLQLHFHGPLSFAAGDKSLFHSAFASKSCIYLWTFESAKDGRYHIHYVGEALRFAKRQRDHLIGILGLDYGIFDALDARQGVEKRIWNGLWRDKSPDGPGRVLAQYASLAEQVVKYVESLAVFVAPIEGSRELRRHVEGSIGWNLRNKHQALKVLYPDDNHIGTSINKMNVRLDITSDASIAGLDSWLDI